MANNKTHNCRCLICKIVFKTQNGMLSHLRNEHTEKMRIGENWEWTHKKITARKRRYNVKGKTKKKTPIVLTPKSEYIDILAVIRVPIVIGQAQIIQMDQVSTSGGV